MPPRSILRWCVVRVDPLAPRDRIQQHHAGHVLCEAVCEQLHDVAAVGMRDQQVGRSKAAPRGPRAGARRARGRQAARTEVAPAEPGAIAGDRTGQRRDRALQCSPVEAGRRDARHEHDASAAPSPSTWRWRRYSPTSTSRPGARKRQHPSLRFFGAPAGVPPAGAAGASTFGIAGSGSRCQAAGASRRLRVAAIACPPKCAATLFSSSFCFCCSGVGSADERREQHLRLPRVEAAEQEVRRWPRRAPSAGTTPAPSGCRLRSRGRSSRSARTPGRAAPAAGTSSAPGMWYSAYCFSSRRSITRKSARPSMIQSASSRARHVVDLLLDDHGEFLRARSTRRGPPRASRTGPRPRARRPPAPASGSSSGRRARRHGITCTGPAVRGRRRLLRRERGLEPPGAGEPADRHQHDREDDHAVRQAEVRRASSARPSSRCRRSRFTSGNASAKTNVPATGPST